MNTVSSPLTTTARAVLALLCVAQAAGVAGAEVGKASTAPRLLHVPTAYLQPPRGVYLSAGGSHRKGVMLAATTGLGQLAEIDIELSDSLAVCSACSGDETHADSLMAASALFKIGLQEDWLGGWQPALALGYQKTLWTDVPAAAGELTCARVFAVASQQLGPIQVHAGVDLWDAEVTSGDRRELLSQRPLGERIRPLGGFSWVPSIYPRTSLIGDISWVPVVEDGTADLRWLAGWGVRYQALEWSSIELSVRHREGDDLDDSTVMIRINGVFSLAGSASRPRSRPRGSPTAARYAQP